MREVILGVLVAGAVCAFVFLLFSFGRRFKVNRQTVPIERLPDAFDGFRICLISDLHDRQFGKQGEKLSLFIQTLSPNLIAMAGDMHESPHSPESFYALCRALSKTASVYYTEGNHDPRPNRNAHEREEAEHLSALRACGVTVLNEGSVTLEKNSEKIHLYGLSWTRMVRREYPLIDPGIPSILICHDPLCFDRLPVRADLMVSGHVHGGLIELPWIGPVFSPGNGLPLSHRFTRQHFTPTYSKNLYRCGKHTLAVSVGLGFSVLPIRFFAPEVVLLTLRKADKTSFSMPIPRRNRWKKKQ